MLYLVGTPIGNLGDISQRGIETLKNVSLILCEDTRTSGKLLKHYGITTKTQSFHKFNERERESQIIDKLKSGEEIALISDAGMPTICDPGAAIIQQCHAEEILVQVVPGPSALIAALSLTGWSYDRFQFLGYVEKKEGMAKEQLLNMLTFEGVSIAYDTPHQILKTLTLLNTLFPQAEICIARELTKLYEECLKGSPSELLSHFKNQGVKGEIVLMIQGHEPTLIGDPKDWVEFLKTSFHISNKEALSLAAKWLKRSKKELYNLFHN